MSVKSVKSDFRKQALIKLKNQSIWQAKCVHYPLIKRLINLIKFTKSKKILIYMPLFYEVDLYKIHRILAKDCEIFVPFMVGLSLEMVKLKMPFCVSKFKIKEPLNAKVFKKRIEMAIIPVVGVDGALSRIGYGKGFYDRFFESLSYRPLIVFVQKIEIFTKDLISENHDISCDYYLTSNKNYLRRGQNDRNFSRLRSKCGGSWSRVSVRKKDK